MVGILKYTKKEAVIFKKNSQNNLL